MSAKHRKAKKKEEKRNKSYSETDQPGWRLWLSREIYRQMKRSPYGRGKRVSKATKNRCFVRDGGCAKCGGSDIMTVHHVIPKRLGGPNTLDNLITLCDWCHADWNSLEARDVFKWFQFFIWLDERISYDKEKLPSAINYSV